MPIFVHSNLQNSSVNALLACNNASVDAALDVMLQQNDTKKRSPGLSAIDENSSKTLTSDPLPQAEETLLRPISGEHMEKRKQRITSPEKSFVTGSPRLPPKTDGSYESSGISRISPITLPGFQTPINFSDLPPPQQQYGIPPSYSGRKTTQQQYDFDTHSDSSPTRTSPPYIHCSPPPYCSSPETKTHVHVSPPPEVHPQSYSPFSNPYSYTTTKTSSPYERALRTRITPTSDFSDSGIEEEVTPRRTSVPPEAFKFFIKQHIENIYKSYHQRQQRRLKLEQEMARRKLDEATSEQMRRILFQKE